MTVASQLRSVPLLLHFVILLLAEAAAYLDHGELRPGGSTCWRSAFLLQVARVPFMFCFVCILLAKADHMVKPRV